MSSDEEIINSEIGNVEKRIRKNWEDKPSFGDLRLLLITPSQWLRVYKGHMETHYEAKDAFINRLGKRGEILDFFSKLEDLIDNIIQARILGGLFSPKARDFDVIIQKIPFAQCIRILIQLNVITGDLKGKINALRDLRNDMAHSWSEGEVYYKTGRLKDNIKQFKEDAKDVWYGLIDIYMKLEVKDLHILLDEVGDYNTINMYNDIFRERKSREITDEE